MIMIHSVCVCVVISARVPNSDAVNKSMRAAVKNAPSDVYDDGTYIYSMRHGVGWYVSAPGVYVFLTPVIEMSC